MSTHSNRREFLQRSAMAAGAAAAIGTGGHQVMAADNKGCPHHAKKEAVLKLSSQERPMAGDTLDEKLDNMEKWGFTGYEPYGKGLPERVKEIKNALKGRDIKVSAICAGFQGCLISEKKEQRELAMKTMKEILSAAGELGSVGMIMVPAFNRHSMMPHKEARILLSGFHRWDKRPAGRVNCVLQDLGDHAVKAGTRIIMEPLNRQECYFLRTLADAASICKDVDNPGVGIMGDFWHMTWEETSDYGAIISAADYLHHIHMASRKRRKIPGEDGDADNYVQGFKALKEIGYADYVSLECRYVGDPYVVIPAAVKLLRNQWDKA